MEKEITIVSILLITLAVALVFSSVNIIQSNITSSALVETHSHTKAVCNSTNYCQDYLIRCSGNRILSTNPITGAAVQFPDSWPDPRDQETINGFC